MTSLNFERSLTPFPLSSAVKFSIRHQSLTPHPPVIMTSFVNAPLVQNALTFEFCEYYAQKPNNHNI